MVFAKCSIAYWRTNRAAGSRRERTDCNGTDLD